MKFESITLINLEELYFFYWPHLEPTIKLSRQSVFLEMFYSEDDDSMKDTLDRAEKSAQRFSERKTESRIEKDATTNQAL